MDEKLRDRLVELLRRASTDLPADVEAALVKARASEEPGSSSRGIFDNILLNVELARKASTPICQDTGSILFEVRIPRGFDDRVMREALLAAATTATKSYYLRPNAVDSLTGKNSGSNVGIHSPVVHLETWDDDSVQVRVLLKGGGSENVSTQFRLPDSSLQAGRDLKGVRKLVLKAVYDAQGKGCSPGVIGVAIGGDRMSGYQFAKEQLFRKIGQRSDNPDVAKLETELVTDLNTLGIGPMGLGGKTTVLDVFIGAQHRHPATYFVTVAYMCWACRRRTMTIRKDEVTYD
ncbi:MAG: fumarate hydratase [Deltaproteobacteria bacterium]|nr:fumarate hydratase [Deltaproteobacteria bacterium]